MLNSSPTELTTGITDAILSVLALLSALYLYRFKSFNPQKIQVWVWVTILLAIGSTLGFVVHGLELSPTVSEPLWFPLYLSLALAVALFADSAIYDGWGAVAGRRALIPLLLAGAVFSILPMLLGDSFIVFILYEGCAMLFSLGVYIWIAASKRSPGTIFIVLGILLTILAAILQTIRSIRFTVIWQFDNNSAFHIVQMLAVIVLVIGISQSVARESRPTSIPSGAAYSTGDQAEIL